MIFFAGGGGALALDDGACGPLLFQKEGIFPTTNKTLKVHSYHLISGLGRVLDKSTRVQVQVLERMTSTSTSTSTGFSKVLEYKYKYF